MADHGLAGHTDGVDLSAGRHPGGTEPDPERKAGAPDAIGPETRSTIGVEADDRLEHTAVDRSNLGENQPPTRRGPGQWPDGDRPARGDSD